ncbi:myb/SANT-like DNA-binding domain-containing protein 4 [Callorhinchus milii]|uniref:Myb/SANT-like DNA-binding domain-containing protein 4 n=1 Tax=Callorhinchus milii TaxID=7868 RepID=A0A4W3JG49_CALMI|nr:myb/SANT-like DNA-binding domain-containing protein 4 [Callorhinchus milii]XP_007902630.1 myb/SANT-like DNA-binding domain-containing protein 4 [Callorhinchus milii]|eukprot:gi/632972377/ref/XP_007902627.1/ PREDICTED: myb/SANT-like DNA-binding domain-containing protein 4 [Callorhinchus milii]
MKQFKRKRKSNFTMKETETLLKEVEQRRDIIYTQHHDAITNELKWMAWKEISEKVSAASGGEQRTAYEVKKKYTDLKCYLKKRGECLDRMEMMMTDYSPLSINGFSHSAVDGETSCKFDNSLLVEEHNRPLYVVKVEEDNDKEEEEPQNIEDSNTEREFSVFAGQLITGVAEDPDNFSEVERESSNSEQATLQNGDSHALLSIEKQRLELERRRLDIELERLQVEKERLQIEKERLHHLDIENERLQLEKERLQLEKERLHIKREKLKLLSKQTSKPRPEKECPLQNEMQNFTPVNIETEKLKLERERLQLEKERLQFLNIENEKLQIEKERLQIEREHLQLQKGCQRQ